MKFVHRNKTIEFALGYKEFWEHAQRFFGQNNFTHEEVMAIMHHINSAYFMGLVPESLKKRERMEWINTKDRLPEMWENILYHIPQGDFADFYGVIQYSGKMHESVDFWCPILPFPKQTEHSQSVIYDK